MSAIEQALDRLDDWLDRTVIRGEFVWLADEDREIVDLARTELAELRTENEKLKRAWLATYYEDGNA